MRKKQLLLFLFSLFFPILYHTNAYGKMLDKKLVSSDMHCYINGMPIHCYETNDADGEKYIIAEDLAKYGFGVYFSYENTGSLQISYHSFEKAYITTELEDRGKQCFDIYETDIITTIGGTEEREVKSYNIGGQTAIPICALDYYGNIIYSNDGNTIYFECTPTWNIILPDDHKGDTSKELSHFKIEMTRDEKGEWNIKGENRQYLSSVVVYWEKPTKTYIQVCIPKTFSEQSKKILKLFENNPDLNSKQKSTQQDIDIANEHTEIYINGEKANITQVKYEGWGSPFYDFYFYLDKDVFSPNNLQSMTIECNLL